MQWKLLLKRKSFQQVVLWSWSSTFENVSHSFGTDAYINDGDIKDVSTPPKKVGNWWLKMIMMNEIAMLVMW